MRRKASDWKLKRTSLLSQFCICSFLGEIITKFAETRPFGPLNSPPSQNSLILLSCKRGGFTGASQLFRARKSRQFGQRIREKIQKKKSLHSSSGLRREISLPAKNRKKGESREGESRGVERRKAFFATWKTITGLERRLLLLSLSIYLSIAVSTTGSFQLVSCGRDPSVESRRRRQLRRARCLVA